MLKSLIMETLAKSKTLQPISPAVITSLLVCLVVILSIAAGCFHQLWTLEMKRYASLEDKYVRVRNMIGRESMQNLIDKSYSDLNEVNRNEVE